MASRFEAQRVPGSFRDPDGSVFIFEERVFRSLEGASGALAKEIFPQEWFQELFSSGMLIRSDLAAGAMRERLGQAYEQGAEFLEHERLRWISYPYEWSFSMLADAAVHTLSLEEQLAVHGLALKDASAYNVQVRSGKPVFIDLGSIERPVRTDLWFALGQFQRMFLYPLLLARYKGWDFRSYFLGALDGRNLEQVARSFSKLDLARPSLWLDLWLPLWLERRDAKSKDPRKQPAHVSGSVQSQLLNLRRLRRKIEKLQAGYKVASGWSDYQRVCSYSTQATAAKKGAIQNFLMEYKPKSVLDLGCNTGEYSELAADANAFVISTDADHDAIELLYRRVRGHPREIHPLVLDLANPSPGIGSLNVERAPFLERTSVECVMALALIHHLLVSANLPLEIQSELFDRVASKYLILEFVPRQDPMFQRLIRDRVDLYAGYNLESCKQVFGARFELLKEVQLADSPRTLLMFQKRL